MYSREVCSSCTSFPNIRSSQYIQNRDNCIGFLGLFRSFCPDIQVAALITLFPFIIEFFLFSSYPPSLFIVYQLFLH